MSITDDQTEEQAESSTSEETEEITEELPETPSDESTDSDDKEESTSEEEITETEESSTPKKATPEESRSYYEQLTREKLETERKQVKEQATRYTRMDDMRKAVAENPRNFDSIVSADEVLAQEMLNSGDVVMTSAYDNHSKYSPKAKSSPAADTADLDKLVDEKLKVRADEDARRKVFDNMETKHPGFKGSEVEKAIISKLGGVDSIRKMDPSMLSELVSDLHKANASKVNPKDNVKDAEAALGTPPTTAGSEKGKVKLTKSEEAVYKQALKMAPGLTREEFKAHN